MIDTLPDTTLTTAVKYEQPLVPGATLSRGEVETQLSTRLRIARDARRPHDPRWRKNVLLYNNDYDKMGVVKQDWQARGYVPKVSIAVSAVANAARAAIMRDRQNWCDLSGQSPNGKLAAPILKALALDCLDRHDFVRTLKPNIKIGLLTPGPVYKVYPVSGDTAYPGDTCVDAVDYRRVFKDPSGRNKWVFHVTEMDLADAEAMAPDYGWDASVLSDLQSNAAPNGGVGVDDEWKREFGQQLDVGENEQYRRVVYIAEYYGPLFDTDGRMVEPFVLAFLANGSRLLGDYIPDPFGDGEGCLIANDLDARQGQPYGKAYVDDVSGIALSQTHLVNQMQDTVSFLVPAWAVQRSKLVDPTATDKGIYPGMVLDVREKDAITPLQSKGIDPSVIGLYQLLDAEGQGATSVTDIQRGIPAQHGTRELTLGEVSLKAQAADQNVSAVSQDLEDFTFVPLVKRLVRMIGTRVDLRHEAVRLVAGTEIDAAVKAWAVANVPPQLLAQQQGPPQPGSPLYETALEALQAAMSEKFDVRVTGISTFVNQSEKAQGVLNVFGAAQQAPPIAAQVDPRKLFKALVQSNGLDVEDVGDDDEAYRNKAQQQRQGPPPTQPAESLAIKFSELPPFAQAQVLQRMGIQVPDGWQGQPQPGQEGPDPTAVMGLLQRHEAEGMRLDHQRAIEAARLEQADRHHAIDTAVQVAGMAGSNGNGGEQQ